MVEETKVKAKKKSVRKKAEPHLLETGRPISLNDKVQERMVELLRLGAYAEDAASDVDISRATFYNWMNRGRKERERLKMIPDAQPKLSETKYLNFLDAIEGARGKGTILLHSQIVRAATNGDWRASAYILERTRPEQYGNKEKLEHSGAVEGKLTVEMGDLEDKVLQLLELRKAKGGKSANIPA